MEQGSDIESNGLPQGCQQLSGRKIEGGPSKDGNKKKGSNSGVLGAALSKYDRDGLGCCEEGFGYILFFKL